MSDLDKSIAEGAEKLRSESSELAKTFSQAFAEAVKARVEDPKVAANLLFDFIDIFEGAGMGFALAALMGTLTGPDDKQVFAAHVSVELLKEINTGFLLASSDLCAEIPVEDDAEDVPAEADMPAENVPAEEEFTADGGYCNDSTCSFCFPTIGAPDFLSSFFAGVHEGS